MKWEYLAININMHDFADFGKAGFELVAIDNGKAYFKRPYISVCTGPIIEEQAVDKNGKAVKMGDMLRFKSDSNTYELGIVTRIYYKPGSSIKVTICSGKKIGDKHIDPKKAKVMKTNSVKMAGSL
jgi:hypothetical protein